MAVARGLPPLADAIVRQQLVALLEGDRAELTAATARLLAMRDAASARARVRVRERRSDAHRCAGVDQ
jgi:hypothetical protein